MTHFKHSGLHIDVHWKSRVRLMPTGDKFDHENPFAESLIDKIMLNPEKGAQDTPLKGIRSDYFYTIKKKCFNDVATEDNGAYLNSRSNKRVYAVGSFNDGELQNVKIVHKSNNGSYFYKS